jgi:putative DNA primase/helicase
MDTTEIINSFIKAMKDNGCEPSQVSDINPSGEDTYYRLKDDKKDKRGAYCLTIDADGFAYGNFYNFRTGEKGSWHSKKGDSGISDTERDELQKRFKESQERKEKEKLDRQERVALIAREDYKSFTQANENHPYLIKKSVKPLSLKQRGEQLVCPMIFNDKLYGYQTIDSEGNKYFLEGARKEGCYYPLIKKTDDLSTIYIVEGVATGLSVREAIDKPTVIGFDAGNLYSAALSIKKKYPDSKLVFLADNDHETKINGKLHNTGITKAQQAAIKIGKSKVIFPEFKDVDKSGNTDFNDLHKLYGLEAVKDRILSTPKIEEGATSNPVDVSTPPNFNDIPLHVPEDRLMINQGEPLGDFGMPFKVLGFSDGTYYYYSFFQKEIVKLPATGHTMMALLQLANLDQWESQFPKASRSQIALFAANKLIDLAKQRGIFNEENRVRGTGVWRDAKRIIVNCGNKIYVNGEEVEFHEIKSHYTYIAGASLPPITTNHDDVDFSKLQDICSMPTWDNKASGILLAGWITVAPLCSALSYRPHIFITGQSGSGKSTIIDNVICKCLKGITLRTDGMSTEASIREKIGSNTRPVVFDEAEGKGTAVTSMDSVLALARSSSTGGKITKFGQKEFSANSPFCFSAINPPIKNLADESRISRMVLRKNKSLNAKEHYREFCKMISTYITDDFSQKLFSYCVKHVDIINKNMAILSDKLRDVLNDPRASDLIGVMLSGYWILSNPREITEEEALALIKKYDWTEHTAVNDENDSERLLHYLCLSIIKVDMLTIVRDATIGELIANCIGKADKIGFVYANKALRNYSICLSPDRKHVFIGNKNQNLSRLLKDTDWALSWSRTFSDMEGAFKIQPYYFASGDTQRAVAVPIEHFMVEEKKK